MILLYNVGTTNFTNRGLGEIDRVLSCLVKRQLNGYYEAEIVVDMKSNKIKLLETGKIVTVDTPNGRQPFAIYQINSEMKKKTLLARHIILQELSRNFIDNVYIQNMNGVSALQFVLSKSTNSNTPIQVTGSNDTVASARLIRKNLDNVLIGDDDNSFLNRWGGEFEFDNYEINYRTRLGSDKGYFIQYKKNLLGINAVDSSDAIATRIMPQGFDSLFLPEKYVISPIENQIGFVATKKVQFEYVKSQNSEYADEFALPHEQALQMLRDKSNELFAKGIDKPTLTIRIDFIELSKTEQFSDYAHLESVYIGDTVSCEYEPLNINVESRVNEYIYDSLLGRYKSIVLGTVETSIAKSFRSVQTVVNKVEEIQGTLEGKLVQATNKATEMITNGWGGTVQYRKDEIYIMDAPTIEQAVNVWRYNKNGLGFSSTGINGSYETAITSDGQIVADFITAGTMSANTLYGGVLRSKDNTSWINLDDGSFSLGNGAVSFDFLNGFQINLSGIDIPSGKSAYDLAVENGFVGTVEEWLESQKGDRGLQTYVHVRYSPSSDGSNMTLTPQSDSKYVGFYSGIKADAPTVKEDYTWSLFKGQTGENAYLHIRYSANANGNPMTPTPQSNTQYMGVYSSLDELAPSSYSMYIWTKIKGEAGSDGANGSNGQTSYVHIRYSANSSGNPMTTTAQADTKYIGVTSTFSSTAPTSYASYVWSLIRGADGVNGQDGYTPIKNVDYFDGQKGADGTSTYVHIRYSANANGSSMTTTPVSTTKYIGVYTGTSATAPAYTGYNWSLIKGADGIQGQTGSDGRSSYLHIKYSNDGGATFTSNNGEDVGSSIGMYIDFNQADSMNVSDYTWNLVKGADGYTPIKNIDYFDGKDGQNGQDGQSNYVHIRYSVNSNGNPMTIAPSVDSKYIGIYNGTSATAPSYTSFRWQKFVGQDGVKGETGSDGQTSYLHIKYSNDNGQTFTSNNGEDVGTHIGMYVDFNPTDSTSVSAYTWNLIKGADGYTPIKNIDYFDGVDGQKGADGVSTYVHIRYSANANGSGMTTTPTSTTKYIGVYSGTSSTPPSYTSYNWTLIKGQDGIKGEAGSDGRTPYLHIKYSNDNGATFTANNGEDVGSYIGMYVDFTEADSSSVSSYTWNLVKGADGSDGSDGQSAYIHIRYSPYSNGNMMTTTPSTNSQYIGVVSTNSQTAPTSYTSYKWSLIRGAKGDTGEKGQDATVVSSTPPNDTTQLWLDTNDNLLKQYLDGEWIATTYTTDMQNSEINKIVVSNQTSIQTIQNGMKDIITQETFNTFTGVMENKQTEFEKTINGQVINFVTSETFKDEQTNTSTKFGEISKHIRFVDGNIELGASNSPLLLKIENDRIAFISGDTEVAYFSSNQLYVTDIHVLNRLIVARAEIKMITPTVAGIGVVG